MKKGLLILFFILTLAAFLRFYELPSYPPGLYPDEAMNGNNALEALHTGQFNVFYPENNGREGLFINIQALFLWATGPANAGEPWMLRLPSAIFGTLTVLGIYLLGRELFSEEVGLLSAFFLATNFWHLNFSRIGFRAILAPFFIIFALYFFLRAVKTRAPKKRALHAILAGVFFGLGFYTYIAYRVTPLIFLAFIPFYHKDKKFWQAAAIFVAATFVVALPIGLYFLGHPADFFGRTTQVSVFSSSPEFIRTGLMFPGVVIEIPSYLVALKNLGLNLIKTVGMFNVRGDANWRHNLSGSPELFWPVGILFLIGIFSGITHLSGKGRPRQIVPNPKLSLLLVFTLFLLALLPVIISNEGIPHALRSILLIPPAILLAAIGGVEAYRFLKKYARPVLLRPAIFVLAIFLILNTFSMYFLEWGPNKNTADAFAANYVALGRVLNALPSSIPKYVVVNAGGVLVNGIPMPAQTVMFVTDTYSPENQNAKDIHYILPGQESTIPQGSLIFYLN